MTISRRLWLRLEPYADGQSVAGWVRDERGNEQHFASWLGLLTLLEQVRISVAEENGGNDPEPDDRGARDRQWFR